MLVRGKLLTYPLLAHNLPLISIMDTPLLNSASQETLVTAFGNIGVKSATNITSGMDTPLPTANVSDEILQLLDEAAAALSPKESVTA